MPLSPEAVGTTAGPEERSWTSSDALLYAVAVGAGAADATTELAYTTENSRDLPQRVLPTFAALLGQPSRSLMKAAGAAPRSALRHVGQGVALHRPIPAAGTLRTTSAVTAVEDSGRGGLVVLTAESADAATGEPLFTTTSTVYVRGGGGFGGPRSHAVRHPPPDRPPDHVVTCPTTPGQALLYRLCGDRNPLHSDPAVAAAAGFDRPILHGLCSHGFTGRALLAVLCDGDDDRLVALECRFAAPVLPGDTLTVSVWTDDDGAGATFATATADGTAVVTDGRALLRPPTPHEGP